MRRISLDHLHSFVRVVELGGFSAAADRLNLTQPAVSLQIRELEKRLGVRLIERVGRRATATAAGLDLLDHVRRIEAAVDGALDAMAYHASGAVGRVRIGTGGTACIYLLPPVLRDLRQRFPSLEIVVSTGNTPEVLRAIEANSLDVGLVTLPAPGPMFQVTPVLDDAFVAIFPAGEKPPRAVTAAALAARPVVLYEPGAHTRRIIDEWALRGGAALKPVSELGSVEAIKELVAAGLGCGVLPSMAVPPASVAGRLIVRPLSPRLHRKLAIVLRRDKPLQRGLREVVTALSALGRKTRRGARGPAEVTARRSQP
ncbi:MAG: LysR family transcriptional regulator [Alphaproteobacteria bacterium]|nr:LysR family transcriptional regulator [Alphaproteobacteria bacterium]